MENNNSISHLQVRISDKEFAHLGDFIHREYGIKMPPVKKIMLESRLQKRLKALGMKSFAEYSKYLFSKEGIREELIHMVDMVTTNKTDFFREAQHFAYLTGTALPELEEECGAGYRRPLKLWSAGCSSGEEPYTIAMVLADYAVMHEGFRFEILGTDISTRMLEHARQAIYEEQKVAPVPPMMKKKYLLRSKDRDKGMVRIAPELRATVSFRRINFMEGDFGLREMMDVVFCRNVIIYFDKPTQERLLNRLAAHMAPGGFIFMGHSETLSGLSLPLRPVVPTVYRKPFQGE